PLLSPAGTSVGPPVASPSLSPQAVTVPLFRRARLCSGPEAIAVALVRSGGTCVTNDPGKLAPQAMTVPLLCKARPWFQPAAIALTLAGLVGTCRLPAVGRPNGLTVPSA